MRNRKCWEKYKQLEEVEQVQQSDFPAERGNQWENDTENSRDMEQCRLLVLSCRFLWITELQLR